MGQTANVVVVVVVVILKIISVVGSVFTGPPPSNQPRHLRAQVLSPLPCLLLAGTFSSHSHLIPPSFSFLLSLSLSVVYMQTRWNYIRVNKTEGEGQSNHLIKTQTRHTTCNCKLNVDTLYSGRRVREIIIRHGVIPFFFSKYLKI